MSTEIEVNKCYCYKISFKNENFATFTFVVEDMFNLQTKTSKTFSQVLAAVIKTFRCSILHFQMYSNSLNGEYKMLS